MNEESEVLKVSQQGSVDLVANDTASPESKDLDVIPNKTEKSSDTTPAVSRYGRTHKPKISDDFLPTDKKVGAILGISPKRQLSLENSDASSSQLQSIVEKGRIVSELLGGEGKKKSKRSRKPKLHQINIVNLVKKIPEDDESEVTKPLVEVIKSEASTSDKVEVPSDVKIEAEEEISCKVEKENEIMNPDVTSSVDDNSLSKNTGDISSSVDIPKGCGWNPGDLAWARIGGHPFWPSMIATDPLTKEFTKVKRVGRGLTSVQRSLHVQFFGDNGRHSWVPTSCVIRFEGKDGLQNFADKILMEIKKKDKKFLSAFVIRPSSKLQWDLAVREAEDALPKTIQERIGFFEKLFPPENWTKESNLNKQEGEIKRPSRTLKRKKNYSDLDQRPLKQVKVETQVTSITAKEETVVENTSRISRRKRAVPKGGKRDVRAYQAFTEKYSKHASEIHPGITDEKLDKLMLRMWSAMDEAEKAMYYGNAEESSSDDDLNDNDNSSLSTRESSPLLLSQPLKKSSGLFRGTRQEKVCQLCLKPGNTVKCKGACLGVFHIECIKNPHNLKEEGEVETKKRRGRASKVSKLNDSLNRSNTLIDKSVVEQLDDSVETNSNFENDRCDSEKEENKLVIPCVGDDNNGEFRCKDCSENRTPACFICNKENDPQTNSDVRIRCINGHCGKYYHLECVKAWPQASCVDGQSKKQAAITYKPISSSESTKHQVLTCPLHVCHTCASDDPRNATLRFNHERLVRCVLCPTAYHTGNHCVPAGSEILTGCQIICPRHYEPPAKGIHHVNAAWCFICAMGGSLICCDLCPTSFHAECLRIAPPEGGYICEDCDTGRYPLYGEVVWVKLGAYRWWPALILFPTEIPDNIGNLPHKLGEFAVKFFGSHDHYWVNRGRVFLYQEGDTGHKSAKRTSVDGLFLKALDEAKKAHAKFKVERSQREAEARPGLKPPSYIRIKCNKPVGNVRVYEADLSSMTPCDCDPNAANPCGVDSDCLNRILMVECTPGVCAAGDKCGNQFFLKRKYPPLEPFKTESRGWGLRALKDLHKGEFVIEYVGEMIDETEYRKRLECMHKEKDENYYFLTIDNQRMLDAGPKGNVARFMNHSCQPNCETQKWTVNGDTRVGLFALKDIKMGEELTFNYNLECVGTDKKPCMCGAGNCSGFIGVKVTKAVEDDKKTKFSKDQQRALKRKRKRQATKLTEGECFECGGGGELLLCDNKTCPKGFHLSCAKQKTWPKGTWLCPWHFCDVCKRRTGKRCGFCPRSYCMQHMDGNIRMNCSLGMVCRKHDEDAGKSSVVPNGIMEDVEICLKGIAQNSKNDDIPEQTLSNDLKINFGSEHSIDESKQANSANGDINYLSTSLECTNVSVGSALMSIVDNVKFVEEQDVKVQNVSLVDGTIPKKRGRPRKNPFPEYVIPQLMSPVKIEHITTEVKTPEFKPETTNVSTIKRKRGRPRKRPEVLSSDSLCSNSDTPISPPTKKEVSSTSVKKEEQSNIAAEETIEHSQPLTESFTSTSSKTDNLPSTQLSSVNDIKITTIESDGEQNTGIKAKVTLVAMKQTKLTTLIKIGSKKDVFKESENSINLKETSSPITPRMSGRKRHLSEKLTAFLSKFAKKHGVKSIVSTDMNININSIVEEEPASVEKSVQKHSESLKVPSKLYIDKTNDAHKLSQPKKSTVSPKNKPSISVVSQSLKLKVAKSIKSEEISKPKPIVDSVPSCSFTSNKSKSILRTKGSPNDAKQVTTKVVKLKSSQEIETDKVRKVKSEMPMSDKPNLAVSVNDSNKTNDPFKVDKPIYTSFFKSYQKKSSILQRVNHKPDLGKNTSDFKQKLSYSTTIHSTSLLNGNSELHMADKIKYEKTGINGIHDIDSSTGLLESFEETGSNFFSENITIPLKCSEFDQTKDEFSTTVTTSEEMETQGQLEGEFNNHCDESNSQKLSEDGKYQILTNMRPESLDFDKQSSVLMPVSS